MLDAMRDALPETVSSIAPAMPRTNGRTNATNERGSYLPEKSHVSERARDFQPVIDPWVCELEQERPSHPRQVAVMQVIATVLERATPPVKSPTGLVIRAVENDWPEWQKLIDESEVA